VAALASVVAAGSLSAQQTVYSNIPTTLAPNYTSLSFQATQTSEFGNLVHLGGTARTLNSVSVVLSNWTPASRYPDLAAVNATGYNYDLTLNLYNVGTGGTVGSLLATVTQSQFIAWRPEGDAQQCGNLPDYGTFQQWYSNDDNACHGGQAQLASFDFSSLAVNLPEDVIVGLAFNTQSYGAQPTGVEGPYTWLNFAVGPTSTTVGSNDADVNYVATTYPGWEPARGPEFGRDTDWGNEQAMIAIDATTSTPEPASMVLLATGLAGVGAVVRRRRKA
jgi:hypothetical protein